MRGDFCNPPVVTPKLKPCAPYLYASAMSALAVGGLKSVWGCLCALVFLCALQTLILKALTCRPPGPFLGPAWQLSVGSG